MTERQSEHARRVVEQFESMLEPEQAAALGAEALDQLALLVESAINTAVVEALEKAADAVQRLGEQMRFDAEHFDE